MCALPAESASAPGGSPNCHHLCTYCVQYTIHNLYYMYLNQFMTLAWQTWQPSLVSPKERRRRDERRPPQLAKKRETKRRETQARPPTLYFIRCSELIRLRPGRLCKYMAGATMQLCNLHFTVSIPREGREKDDVRGKILSFCTSAAAATPPPINPWPHYVTLASAPRMPPLALELYSTGPWAALWGPLAT